MSVHRRIVLLLLSCLFLAGVLTFQNRTAPSAPASASAVVPASADNWGLAFPQEGASPVGNATVEDLAQYGAYYLGDNTIHPSGKPMAFPMPI